MTLSAITVPSASIREASQAGTRPPCNGRSAVPDRFTRSSFLGHRLTYPRCDPGPDQLDAAHQQVVPQRAGAVLEVEPRKAEEPRSLHHFRRDCLRRTHVERAIGTGLAFEMVAACGRPPAFSPNAVDHLLIVRPELVSCLFVG